MAESRIDETDLCSFGEWLGETCHQKRYQKILINFLELTDDQQIFKWRANIYSSDVTTICEYHRYKFGKD